MRISTSFQQVSELKAESEPGARTATKKGQGKKQGGLKFRPQPERLSANEIRDRVKKGINQNTIEKKQMLSSQNRDFTSSMPDDVERENVEKVDAEKSTDHLMRSDVGLNDPNDPATVGKLKQVLSSGAFSFNPKEREALSAILAEHE